MYRRFLSVFILASALLGGQARSIGADPWQGQSIYQIVTDRFFNGDVGNDNADGNYNAAAGQGVHGGDFKGIEQKLDYIKALGATAIWISPVVLNGNGDYHGYAARDFYSVDPHFGTLSELQHLIQTAHAKGLLVIDDVVVNHGGQLLNSNDSGYPTFKAAPGYNLFYRDNSKQYAPPFDPASGQSLTSLFHNNGFIQDFNNTTQVETGSLQGLDDFRTESSYVQTNMAAIYKFWIDQGFDGFRVDTVKHVDHSFWQAWCPQIHQYGTSVGKPNFFLFGEVYDGSEAKVGSYTGVQAGGPFELDSVLDYPLYFSINSVFARGTSPTKAIEDHYQAIDANYDTSARAQLVTFLDNHDQPRFLNTANANNDLARLHVALTFLYTARGIPALYYGTEQGFNGGADPSNREDMFAGQFEQGPSLGDNFNFTSATFQDVAKLNNFRRLYPALRTGTHVNLWNDPNGPGLFAYARRLGGQEVLVVLNTAQLGQTLPPRPTSYPSGTLMVNLLDPTETLLVTSDGQIPSLAMAPSSAKIFIAQSQMLPLDPVVTDIAPSHDMKNVPTPSKIVLHFSKPMDQASVEAAFSTFPATTGTFSWSGASDQLTYQASTGLPELSTIFVRLSQGAADSNGRPFYAPFEARFTTAARTVVDVVAPTVTITSPSPGASLSDANGTTPVLQGSAADDNAIQSVQIKLDNGNWYTVRSGSGGKTADWFQPIYTSFYPNGPHTFSARSIDAAGNISAVSSIPVSFGNMPTGTFDVGLFGYPNGPGFSITDCNGYYWQSDQPYVESFAYFSYGYIGGSSAFTPVTIQNVCQNEQGLYRYERYSSATDTVRYLYNCPPGVYEFTVLNAETFMNGPNQRRFDVYVQGERVLQNFDIFAEAGGADRPVKRTFTATVANGLADVQFKPVYNNARVTAVRVRKIGEAFSGTDGVPDWWRLKYFGHATGSADDLSRAGDDPDKDGRTNFEEARAGTDPFSATSVFRVTDVQRHFNDIVVSFTSVLNKIYQLQRTGSLSSSNWINIGTPTTAPFSGEWSVTDSGGAIISPPPTYRVVVMP